MSDERSRADAEELSGHPPDQAEMDEAVAALAAEPGGKNILVRILVLLVVLGVGFYLLLYLPRRELADDLIRRQLAAQGLEASYEVTDIGAREQLLSNLVVGDPARPDLTVEKLTVRISPRFGLPTIEEISLAGVRLFGDYHDGKLSFGTLDPVIFADSDTPPGLPDTVLSLTDTRAVIDTDYGIVAVSVTGDGNIADGFTGHVAALGKDLSFQGCKLRQASVYAAIETVDGRPSIYGPLRADGALCEDGASLADLDAQVKIVGNDALDRWSGSINASGERFASAVGRARTLRLNGDFAWSAKGLDGRARLGAGQVAGQGLAANGLGVQVNFTASPSFTELHADGNFSVTGADLARLGRDSVVELAENMAQTPLGPLLKQFTPKLARDLNKAAVQGRFAFAKNEEVQSFFLERLRLNTAAGAPLLLADQLQIGANKPLSARINIVGSGWPALDMRLSGNTGEQRADIRMRAWSAKDASIGIPEMQVVRRANGIIGFAGRVVASGPIPAGRVTAMNLPLEGAWSENAGLILGRRCMPVRFDRLELAAFDLGEGSLSLCPDDSRAIVQSTSSGLRINGKTQPLALSGKVGSSPAELTIQAMKIRWPGGLTLNAPTLAIGQGSSATRMAASSLTAAFDDGPHGRFDGLSATIGEVPLALSGGAGLWRYAEALEVQSEALTISDRAVPARFVPLSGPGMILTLDGNQIRATGQMLTRRAERIAMDVSIAHDLSTGDGQAEFTVPGLVFDNALQPDEVTQLALGVVANVNGTVNGSGRIGWASSGVTSSKGTFSTSGMDLAAAFGPVSGLTGNIDFVDLLNLETAPGQTVAIREVNPGIPVNDGVITYRLLPGLKLDISAGRWPFAGGVLLLESTQLPLATDSERNLVFRIEGMDSAILLQKLEFQNLDATGVFDGRVPMVFDQNGGRIEGGRLDAREPGGTLAYVGELSYKDLGTMANFAFGALKALKYREMSVDLNGALDGEIVTAVKFAGIEQGEGTNRNFLTEQVAKPPIIFNVNIRAPFYQLMTSAKSLYDPGYIRDPRDLGLVPGGPAVVGEGDGNPNP